MMFQQHNYFIAYTLQKYSSHIQLSDYKANIFTYKTILVANANILQIHKKYLNKLLIYSTNILKILYLNSKLNLYTKQ